MRNKVRVKDANNGFVRLFVVQQRDGLNKDEIEQKRDEDYE